MKINDSVKKPSGVNVGATSARGGKTAEGADKAGTAKPAGDNVHLSSQVQNIVAQAGSAPVFDTGKVEEIKAAIADGKFHVDPEKVANGLLDTVHDLIRSRKG